MRDTMRLGSFFPAAAFALAALFAPADGDAATLNWIADDPDLVYDPGDTVTLRLVGDAEGATDRTLFAAIVIDTSIFSDITIEKFAPPSEIPWILGGSGCNFGVSGFCPMINMIHVLPGGFADPVTVAGPFSYAVLSATANYSGVYAFEFVTTPSTQRVDFFGLTSAPGITVTVTGDVLPPPPIGSDPTPVPEPTSALLFAAGVAIVRLRLRAS